MESSTAISVQWGPVEPCADQNGPITGYSVRYGEMGSGSTQNKTVSGESRMTTISELTKETVYTVEVAAETRAGTGVYSLPLTIQTPDSECGPAGNPRRACARVTVVVCLSVCLSVTALAATVSVYTCNQRHPWVSLRFYLILNVWNFEIPFRSRVMA